MRVRRIVGNLARRADRRFGIMAWLNAEPRPPAGGFDLAGEKFIDWGWVCVNLPPGPKRALEIGPGHSPIIPAMLAQGYDVTAVDLCMDPSQQMSGFTFVRGDFNEIPLEPGFEVIVACSTIEHIGLSGRYESDDDKDGDLKAMRKIAALLHPEGTVLLTIPVGADAVYRPWHRVYGRDRMTRLLEEFECLKSRFLVKEPWGPWRETSRKAALDTPEDLRRYALGEMVLRKKRR